MTLVSKDLLKLFSYQAKGHLTKYVYTNTKIDWLDKLFHSNAYYLQNHDRDLFKSLQPSLIPIYLNNFNIFEIGPGCGESISNKTLPLITAIKAKTYTAIDINHDYAFVASQVVNQNTKLVCNAIEADAFAELPIAHNDNKVVMLIGSTLGNLVDGDLSHFLSMLNKTLKTGEHFLVTVDTCHDQILLKAAYDNIYLKELCLNVMRCLKDNGLADQPFDPELFSFKYHWNDEKERVELYLKATATQSFTLENNPIVIEKGHEYHVVTSRKFSIKSLGELALEYGFRLAFTHSVEGNHMLLAALEKVNEV